MIVATLGFLALLAAGYWLVVGLKKLAAIVLLAPTPRPMQPDGTLSPTYSATRHHHAHAIHPAVVTGSDAQWWLSLAGQVMGPFATTVITDRARTGQLGRDTHVCQVGGTAWMPLGEWLRGRNTSN